MCAFRERLCVHVCVRVRAGHRRASPYQKIHLEVIWSFFLKVRTRVGGKRGRGEMRECVDLKASGPLKDYCLIALRLSTLTSAV